MRAAPAVGVDVSGAAAWLWALRGLLALSLLVTVAWAWSQPGLASAAVVAAVLAYALGLAWQTRRPRRWRLEWDGSGWQLSGGSRATESGVVSPAAPRAVQVSVALDLGGALLLRAKTAESPALHVGQRDVWLALQRRDDAAHWHSLRCALHAPQPRGGQG